MSEDKIISRITYNLSIEDSEEFMNRFYAHVETIDCFLYPTTTILYDTLFTLEDEVNSYPHECQSILIKSQRNHKIHDILDV